MSTANAPTAPASVGVAMPGEDHAERREDHDHHRHDAERQLLHDVADEPARSSIGSGGPSAGLR